MDEKFLLLRAINENFAEDTPRLAYADELDEYATTDAERARAELIRVGIAVHRIKELGGHWWFRDETYDKVDNPEYVKMRQREAELIRTHTASWRRPPCRACDGSGKVDVSESLNDYIAPCSTCHGTGSTGALSERDPKPPRDGTEGKHAVTYTRGFPVVTVPFARMGFVSVLSESWDFLPLWLAWAARCIREEGASFHLTGVDHLLIGGTDDDPTRQYWWRDSPVYISNTLPAALLPPDNEFASAELAHAALDATLTLRVVERAYPKETT